MDAENQRAALQKMVEGSKTGRYGRANSYPGPTQNIVQTEISLWKHFSIKSLILALFIAFFLNLFVSAIFGVEPRKNIFWTAAWNCSRQWKN